MATPRKPRKVYDAEIVSENELVVRRPRRAPATTPEARENQLVASAFDLAEKQIREGTASAQVITHFLKLGSEREKLERQKIIKENKLLEAKISGMASAERVEKLYDAAIKAMRGYAGQDVEEDSDDQEVY